MERKTEEEEAGIDDKKNEFKKIDIRSKKQQEVFFLSLQRKVI